MNKYRFLIIFIIISFVFAGCQSKGKYYDYLCGKSPDGETYRLLYIGDKNINKEEIIVKSKYQGKTITALDYRAFWNSTAKRIVLPDTIEKISSDNFMGCSNLTSIHFGASLQDIIPGTFRECPNLSEITISSENPYYYVEENCLIERLTGELVLGCVNSEIPQNVRSIQACAFNGRKELTEITLPDGLLSIGRSAFENTGLTKIEFPEGLIQIGDSAFADTYLCSVRLPDSLSEIGVSVFSACINLQSIYFGACITWNLAAAVPLCVNLEEVIIDETNPVFRAENGCIILKEDNTLLRSLRNSNFPDGILTLEHNSIRSDCLGRTDVVLPNSVITINELAIRGNFTEIYIPASVQTISEGGIFLTPDADIKPTIYCEAAQKPQGWHDRWVISDNEINIVWGQNEKIG